MHPAMNGLPALIGHTASEIKDLLSFRSDAQLRSKQIAQWLYAKAVSDYGAMANLPQDLRTELAASFRTNPLEVVRRATSSDGVDKLLVHGGDGQVFECVLLPYRDRVSCCLSSQVGCPMGCAFCATGLGGFDRNLSTGEIVGQYLLLQQNHLENLAGSKPIEGMDRISRIVFMGMGEPLLNLSEIRKALAVFHDEIGLSFRHITISTVGLVPQIREVASWNLPIHLALSLHSPFDEIRDTLMPVNKRWPVAEVVGAMKEYQAATGRKITIEYLLIGDLTDSVEQARELARLIKGTPSVVNLIPFNWVDTQQGFVRPTRMSVNRFKAELKRLGINATERIERGHDIAAACGQLAGEHNGRFARRDLSPVALQS